MAMLLRSFFLSVFFLVALSSAFASPPRIASRDQVDMTEEKLARLRPKDGMDSSKRSEYRRVIHLYGDSIVRGYGYSSFDDPRMFNRFQDIAQTYLADQGIDKKEIWFRYGWTQDERLIAKDIRDKLILPGDVVVFEDAGPHQNNILEREVQLQNVIDTLKEQKVRLVFTTMFDYNPIPEFFNSYYDVPINENMSVNRITYKRALPCCALLDWNMRMDVLYNRLSILYGVYPMHTDGIHANVIGNLLLARTLIEYLGIPTPNRDPMKERFATMLNAYCKATPWECGVTYEPSQAGEIFDLVEKVAADEPVLLDPYGDRKGVLNEFLGWIKSKLP